MVRNRLNLQPPRSYKKTLYVSKKPLEEELDEYGEPVVSYGEPVLYTGAMGVNYQPITARGDIEMFGANATSTYKGLVTRHDPTFDHFSEESVGDLVYLNGASPTKRPDWDRSNLDVEPFHGAWANYEINAVRVYHMSKHIYFVKHKATGVV